MAYAGGSSAFGKGAHCATITESITLDNQDSGKVFFIGACTAATVITLPSAKSGVHYSFVNTAANSADVYIDTGTASATAPDIYGIVNGAAIETSISAKRYIELENSADAIGDQIDIISDGTNWYCKCFQMTDNAITGVDAVD